MAGRQITIEFLGKDKSLGSTASGIGSKTSRLGGQIAKFGAMEGRALEKHITREQTRERQRISPSVE